MKFKDELREEWLKEKEYLDSLNPKEQKELYRAQLSRVSGIESSLLDYEKRELEIEEKAACRDTDEQLKYRQMEEEIKNQKTKNRIELAKLFVPITAAGLTAILATVYEHENVISLSAVKAAVRDLIRFKA